jgi:hypothetical protein
LRARAEGIEAFAPAVVVVAGLTLTVAYVVALFAMMNRGVGYDVWSAVVVAPVLFGLALPALRAQAIREGDATLFRLLALALALKLAGAFVRFYVASEVYGGQADAKLYHDAGVALAAGFRHLDGLEALWRTSGTEFLGTITGVVYSITGVTELGGFLVFSWLGFWGLFLFYRAFVRAVPSGRPRSYAHFIFFMPSLLFWPSSIGKESWMMFTLGIAAYGIALVLTEEVRRGIVIGAMGLWGAGMVRPHMAGLFGVALVFAAVTRPIAKEKWRELAPVAKSVMILAVALVALVLVVRTDRFLQESGIDTEGGVGTTLQDLQGRTSEGGSSFEPSIVDSPARAPFAALTVLFRPFVFEAHNGQSLLAALEGSVLLLICILRYRWIWAALKATPRTPYLVFAMAYCAMFIVAFSSFANFGLLVRERTQLYPLFLMFLAIPPAFTVAGRPSVWRSPETTRA